jgi:hypothetical protein
VCEISVESNHAPCFHPKQIDVQEYRARVEHFEHKSIFRDLHSDYNTFFARYLSKKRMRPILQSVVSDFVIGCVRKKERVRPEDRTLSTHRIINPSKSY